jgi:hypothetical protein
MQARPNSLRKSNNGAYKHLKFVNLFEESDGYPSSGYTFGSLGDELTSLRAKSAGTRPIMVLLSSMEQPALRSFSATTAP